MLDTLQYLAAHWRMFLYGSLAACLVLMVFLAAVGQVPVSYNVRNLMIRWKTTVMTALAFTLVVALLTIMLAFVKGMYQLTEKSGQPGNVIVLAEGSTDESFSNLNFTDTSDIERQPGILRDEADQPLVTKEVYVIVNQQIAVPEGAKARRRFVQVRGMENPVMAGKVHALELRPGGQWFSEAGVEESGGDKEGAAPKVYIQGVLGSGIAQEMGNDRPSKKPLEPGDTFPLGLRMWKVVGVLDSAGSTFDSEIWAKRSIVGDEFGKKSSYSSYLLRTADAVAATKVTEELKSFRGAALNAQPETEYFSNLGEQSRQFLYAIIVVAAVMAVGGVFGVMNTMFAAISQRTKDIGVLRILGFARRQILVSFLLESLVLALVGGLLGCAVGLVADGWTAKSIVSSGVGGGKSVVLKLVVGYDVLAAGLVLSLVMGALGGFIPALSAMRLRALESLR
jgi:ABC-type lipoprotein release transport system permease subunit